MKCGPIRVERYSPAAVIAYSRHLRNSRKVVVDGYRTPPFFDCCSSINTDVGFCDLHLK